jgi:hypothetical protein
MQSKPQSSGTNLLSESLIKSLGYCMVPVTDATISGEIDASNAPNFIHRCEFAVSIVLRASMKLNNRLILLFEYFLD